MIASIKDEPVRLHMIWTPETDQFPVLSSMEGDDGSKMAGSWVLKELSTLANTVKLQASSAFVNAVRSTTHHDV